MVRSARDFFTPEEQERILRSISEAEQHTSGEVRVHLEMNPGEPALKRAAAVFQRLGMHNTALRNGVLVYLAIRPRQFAIIGDQGIDAVVPEDFWEEIIKAMERDFQEGRICEGVCRAILTAGEQLKHHFPHQAGDINELSNEISFGKD